MGFSEDLFLTVRLLFQYTELVLAKQTCKVGVLHDVRVANILRASQNLQSAIYSLRTHLPSELRPSLDAVNKMTTYIHNSFGALLQYKRPYSASNPCGISVDYNVECTEDGNDLREKLILGAFAMGSMGMLLVHHFALEFTMFACSLADQVYDEQVMTIDDKQKFKAIMVELYDYMNATMQKIESLASHLPVNRDLLRMAWISPEFLYFSDIEMDFKQLEVDARPIGPITDMLAAATGIAKRKKFSSTDTYLEIRMLFYSFVMRSMRMYKDEDDNNDLFKDTDGKGFFKIKRDALEFFKTHRWIEDSNLRKDLLDQFMCFTKNPVYHYATKLVGPVGNDTNYVIQSNSKSVTVAPRQRVQVFRKKAVWDDEKSGVNFAFVHGEVVLMTDLMYNMVPIVSSNRYYRTNEKCHVQFYHAMLTRFFGPCDVLTLMPTKISGDFSGVWKRRNQFLESIVEPHIPTATSIQPAPSALLTWVRAVHATLKDEDERKFMLTNAKFYRPTTLNLHDVLRNERAGPNIIFNRDVDNDVEYNGNYAMNSLLLNYYGKALLSIQYDKRQTECVLGSDNLVIAAAQWNLYHAEMEMTAGNLKYETIRVLRNKIDKLIEDCRRKLENRPLPFLHPTSWHVNHEEAGWEPCDVTYDLKAGTYLTMPPQVVDEDSDAAEFDKVILELWPDGDAVRRVGIREGGGVLEGDGGGLTEVVRREEGDAGGGGGRPGSSKRAAGAAGDGKPGAVAQDTGQSDGGGKPGPPVKPAVSSGGGTVVSGGDGEASRAAAGLVGGGGSGGGGGP